TQGITCFDLFKTNRCTDITCFDKVDRVLFVGVHLHDTADTLVLTGTYVQYVRARIQATAIATEERQATYERIGHDLERKCSKWFLRIRLTDDLLTCIRVCTIDSFYIYRAGQVADNRIQRSLNTFVLISRTTQHWDNAQVYRCFTDSFVNFIFRDAVRIFEEFLHQLVIIFSYGFYQLCTPVVGIIYHVSRYITFSISHTLCSVVPYNRFHTDQVNYTFEVIF